jgi:hypothetical protein
MNTPLRAGGTVLLWLLAAVLSFGAGLLALPRTSDTAPAEKKSFPPGSVKPCRT